jgi:copper chaperone CopZ
MPIEATRIAVDSLSCHDCDCGACLTATVAAMKVIEGVVYVGVDRRRLTLNVRYDDSRTGPDALREAVHSSGLSVAGSGPDTELPFTQPAIVG